MSILRPCNHCTYIHVDLPSQGVHAHLKRVVRGSMEVRHGHIINFQKPTTPFYGI